MQFSSIFVSLLLSTAVVAKGNSTKPVTDKSLCREMNHLQKLVSEAQNSTKLATKTKNNQTKIDEITAKASMAAVQLDTMTSNATLVSTCAVIDAADETKSACKMMSKMQKTIDTANNSTKLAEKSKGNSTKEAELKAKAVTAQTKLDAMTSNTTLVDACSSLTKAKTDGTTSAQASTSSTAKSAGIVLNAKVGSVFSAIVLVAAGTLLL
ncbi:hypothetical protein CJF32_00000949 [Rutstroemia sp. NJR-2017a WRK4]|nr:hypothetical protein CJF32_00000949 [Rutstroemia sp. NJR-2017a WRK4]